MSRKLLFLLALCLIGIVVAYRASGSDFNWDLFTNSLSGMNWGWLIASILVTMATYWIRAIRWQVLLSPLKSVRIAPLFSITIVGFSAIFLLGRAGEVARPLWLSRREKVSLTGSVATIVVERFLDAILLILIFVVALFAEEAPGTQSTTALKAFKDAAWIIAAGAVLAMLALFVLRSNGAAVVRRIPFRRVAAGVESFLQGLSFLRNGRSLGVVFLHSTLLWVAIAVQFWFMLLGMNFDFSLAAATLVMVGAGIGSIAQIPGIGGGFQAGYIFCMTAFFQVPVEAAVATSLMMTVVSFAPTIAIAGLYMMFEGFTIRDLKASSVPSPESETV